jgi:uncharacterized protein (DUF1810 family)
LSAASPDPFDLKRYVTAQDPVFERVLAELRVGTKRSHWMWFVFPQIRGLGFSPTAQRYALASLEEATAYLAHRVLGPRLRECCALVLAIEGRSALEVFGEPDDMKFRSSMTLFSRATDDNAPFLAALEKYFGGIADPATVERL